MRPVDDKRATQFLVDEVPLLKHSSPATETTVSSPEHKSKGKGIAPSSARLAKRPAAPSLAEPSGKVIRGSPRALALPKTNGSGNSSGSDLIIREEAPWDTFKKYYDCDLAGTVANAHEAPVLNGIDLVMHMGDRVGIMGLNGSGKSTLVRLLAGTAAPTKGKVSTHSRLKLGYYAQHSIEELHEEGRANPSLTALGLMTKEVDGALGEGELRGLLSSMGLQGRIVSDVPISRLSGGQLVRLALARVVWNSPQLLILDEITTHLDFHTVTALASTLSSFNGAILLVSHDRFLVRSVIEGKKDEDHNLDDDFEGVDDEPEESQSRRRSVYVMKAGKLNEQQNGVEQFEQSLVKRVQKMLPSPG